MPWYESTAARCNALREALVSSKAIHATDLQKSVEKRILLSKGIF
jgi:hypothetical protein